MFHNGNFRIIYCIMQNISCAHLNRSLLLPLFITCLPACERQSYRDRVVTAVDH